MREVNVLSLGAGVQSSALYLMDGTGELNRLLVAAGREPLTFDAAVFADTQDEPAAVYDHLAWMRGRGCRLIETTRGRLSDDLRVGRGPTLRHAAIPSFTAEDHATRPAEPFKEGRIPRQCTSEYKIEEVDRAVRRDIIGLKARQHFPKDVRVVQNFGISADEIRRAGNIIYRFGVPPGTVVQIGGLSVIIKGKPRESNACMRGSRKWSRPRFPLLELGWGRRQCQEWLKAHVPHPVPRSACVYCPFKSDWEWKLQKEQNPADFAVAVGVDRMIRDPASVCNRDMRDKQYIHRSCVPLDMVDFSNAKPDSVDPMTVNECEGMCGV